MTYLGSVWWKMATGNKGRLELPKMDGLEIRPGIFLIGEPTPVVGTDKLRCLAIGSGALCRVEWVIKFGNRSESGPGAHYHA